MQEAHPYHLSKSLKSNQIEIKEIMQHQSYVHKKCSINIHSLPFLFIYVIITYSKRAQSKVATYNLIHIRILLGAQELIV